MRRPDSEDHLFSCTDPDLGTMLRRRQAATAQKVWDLDPDYLMNVDESDLIDSLSDQFRLETPQLLEDRIGTDEPRDVKIDVRNDRSRVVWDRTRSCLVTGTQVRVTIPFAGRAQLFTLRPSTSTSMPPRADVQGSALVLTFYRLEETDDLVKGEVGRQIAEIKQYLNWVNGSVAPFNHALASRISATIRRRKEKILSDRKLARAIGFPIKRRDGAPDTYRVPLERRKSVISLPTASHDRYVPDPVIEEAQYLEILEIIHNMTLVMERSPSAFIEMKEEALRTHFLVQLNSQFTAPATAETFNFTGKTDILIRHEGQNLFIAECKFWRGPKAFTEALNQLIGYVSWRDSKTALLVFNRTKDTSAVVSKTAACVKAHPSFKRVYRELDISRTCYILAHPQDRNKNVFVTVAVYDIPEAPEEQPSAERD